MAKTMVLLMMAPVALTALAVSAADCTTSFENPTGCVASEVDAGTAFDVTCNLGWSCNNNNEHYQIVCTTSTPGNVLCTCTSDQNNLSSQILINDDFRCDGEGALPVVDKCGNWDLVLQM
jgi:hypothetical protein